MKLISFLIICILTLSASGQEKGLKGKVENFSMKSKQKIYQRVDINSPLKVVYLETNQTNKRPAYFINGKIFSETILKTINPQMIDSISVINEKIEINEKTYHGQIQIKLKDDYKPKFISLNDLKTKYLNQCKNPSIFIIDYGIVNSSYDQFLVDENYILKIEVQKFDNVKENSANNLIRLITKTEENIKRANEIRIRGTDTATLN